MSNSSSSGQYIVSDNGCSTPTDKPASRKGSVPKKDERRPTKHEQAEAESRKWEGPKTSPKAEPEKQHHSEHEKGKMNGLLNEAYSNLLDASIKEGDGGTRDGIETFSPSTIGDSLWTAAEKKAFFSALATKGPNELRALSGIIGTKSELEVRSYLLLLQAHSSIDDSSLSPSTHSAAGEVPAALEISNECETALDLAAETLNRHISEQEIDLEKQRFGDCWLVDERTAAEIEEQQANHAHQTELTAQGDDEETEDETDDPHDSELEAGNSRVGDKTASSTDTSYQPGSVPHIPAADLLVPSNFLQLSRNLFMNSAADRKSNWAKVGRSDSASSTPALFHSALDNFHDVAISVTSRLVNASLFQASSRLRAKDESTPATIVYEDDVRAAADVLGLVDWKRYWASVAWRCDVEVHSDSHRFRDGRPGFKTGYKLTYDEVEAELGFSRGHETLGPISDTDEDVRSTARSCRRPSEDESPAESSNGETSTDSESSAYSSDSDPVRTHSTKRQRKRKRESSPCSEAEETRYLDSIDDAASRAEEKRLMELLNQRVSPHAESEMWTSQDS